MNRLIDFGSRFRILKGGKISLVVSALLGSTIIVNAAPTGGVVTSGSANISQVGNTTNIIQNTGNVTINWNKFNIASNETVNFKQPNVNSIALNRVIGNEKSIINGALNANGQVWILNSNGVLFGKNAKINTAGLLATTKNLSDEDFNAGNYNFKGSSTESVINLGEIDISDSGYATLLANKVSNEGTIKAVKGSIRLIGADEVTINLNGNSIVDLTVNKGVLDSLVENKGAVYADGGEIYLTTNAVNELLKGVVNNEGIIEANSLDGVTGHVELFAHGGEAKIGGTITAKEGFVETSGKDFTFNGAKIEAGEWLIDPVDITIDQALADAIEIQLDSGNVTIETDANNNPATNNNENTNGGGDIFVTGNIEYTGTNDSSLTLKAYRNIIFGDSFTPTTKGSISSTNAALDVILWARAGGNNEATDGRVGSVWLPKGSSISTNGGNVIIGGGQDVLNGYTLGSYTISGENNSLFRGASINGNIDANGGDISIRAKAGQSGIGSARGVSIAGNSTVKTSGTGNISIYGIAKGASDAVAIGDTYFGSGIEGKGIVSADGDIYIEGLKGSGTSSEALYMSNESELYSGNGNIIINASQTGDIKVDLHSSLHAKTLFIFDANNVYLNNFEYGTGHIINNLVGSNINGEFNFTNSGAFTIGDFLYNSNSFNGLVADGNINLISEGKDSSISIDKNIYSISGNTFINGGRQIDVNSNISWDTQSKLTLQSNFVNVNAEIKNTNTTNGGVYFEVSDNSLDVNFGQNGKVVINNMNQLQWMNTALNGNYELGSNIDLSSISNWNPIGNNDTAFTGNFDGLGHTIDNLTINNDLDNVGLFGYTSGATIRSIGLTNVNITGKYNVGGLVGFNANGTIINSYSTGNISGNSSIGGLVGNNDSGTITNSYATGNVSGEGILGGLVGDNYNGTITNSYSTGDVLQKKPEENFQTDNNFGIGGLVGINDGTITNSYATGDVTEEQFQQTVADTGVGGLVGINFRTISKSYSTGKVSGNENIGGLVGYEMETFIHNSYYDKTVNSGMVDEDFFGKTTAQLQNINTFKDGSKYEWSIVEDSTLEKGTPMLSWQVGKSGEEKPVWLIGTKVTSKPTTETPNKEIDKVITTIVNKEAVKVPTPPKVTTTPNNAGKNVNVEFSIGENKQLVSKPIEGQATIIISLAEARQILLDAGIPVDENIRVPLSKDSIIALINGGLLLPGSLQQQVFLSENNN